MNDDTYTIAEINKVLSKWYDTGYISLMYIGTFSYTRSSRNPIEEYMLREFSTDLPYIMHRVVDKCKFNTFAPEYGLQLDIIFKAIYHRVLRILSVQNINKIKSKNDFEKYIDSSIKNLFLALHRI